MNDEFPRMIIKHKTINISMKINIYSFFLHQRTWSWWNFDCFEPLN